MSKTPYFYHEREIDARRGAPPAFAMACELGFIAGWDTPTVFPTCTLRWEDALWFFKPDDPLLKQMNEKYPGCDFYWCMISIDRVD